MNLYDNSGIDCNKKNKNIIYHLYNDIVLNKFVHSNKYKNSTIFTIYKKGQFPTNTRHDSSVTWGHMGNFDLEPNKHNFPTNPMGSSGTFWARLYFP